MALRPEPRLIRLVVPSHDESRVLARPNGLSGWTLPRCGVRASPDGWTEALVAACEAVLGTTAELDRRLDDATWVVRPSGRMALMGTAWIAANETGRLGVDAGVVRAWFASLRTGSGEG
ncbi:MAG: hypothetical protein OSA99_14260 [Acidimicrobiales bacterium]|nr:hypothetical protein [Acidimicrobiales bacterium]